MGSLRLFYAPPDIAATTLSMVGCPLSGFNPDGVFSLEGGSMIVRHSCLRTAMLVILFGMGMGLASVDQAAAQPFGGNATTESVCNFGMAKDQASGTCEVPMPFDCKVANFPGTVKPWTSISKGGEPTCQFDEARSDWKTKITGSCGTCTTQHCSARFGVMFNCGTDGDPTHPYTPQR